MEPNSLKWVGSPCGLHGPYVFYKAFKFHLEDKPKILSLGDFFFVRCKPGDPICIAELQLLWEERTTKQLLSSSKLYFLPEDTPQGRTVSHGEDEIIAVSEKVIVKLDNLVKWTVSDVSQWRRGLKALPLKPSVLKELGSNGRREALHKYRESTLNSGLNFKDVLKEKAELGDDEQGKRVLVLSYPRYCRYRSVIARLRERPSSLLTDQVVLALGGIASLNSNTQILYCRETFDHPTLIENESISEEFAPNLKGRPRKKKLSISQRRDSHGPAKDSSSPETTLPAKVKTDPKPTVTKPKSSTGGCKKASVEERTKTKGGEDEEDGGGEEQAFLVALYKYMKERKTPIERIPYLGFKQINLWTMFQAAQKLGGYELITARRQWKNVYDELGGNPGSTSAATCTRRHYERLILPYERFIKGEEDRPLPPVKPRRPEPGAPEGDSRIKVPAGKRPRVTQNHKNLLETDMLVKSLKPLPVSGNKEENPESPANSSGDSQPPLQQVKEERQKRDMEEEELQLTVKEETLCPNTSEDKPAPRAIPLENGTIGRLSRDPICPLPQGYPETPAHPLSLLEEDPAPGVAPKSLHYSHMQDQWQNGMPDDGTPCSVVKVDQSVAKEAQNQVGLVLPTLKQRLPLQAPRDPEVLQDEEESIFNYKPGVGMHSGSNAGIMSPLAKKKLLSQFSGGASPNNYSFAPPPAFVQAKYIAKDLPGPLGSLAPVAEATVINRPSVIQHAQSFKPRVAEERQKQEVTTQATSDVDPYLQRIDLPQGKGVEKRASSHPPQRPNFLSGFYSAHHLHSLYQQVEHCLSREQLAKYLSRESPFPQRDGSCFTSNQHPDRTGYHPTSGEDEKPPSGEVMSDDQPTDLSLPKSTPHKLSSPKPVLFGLAHTPVHHDVSQPSLFQNSTPDYHPKACRVPPMTFSAPRKPLEPPPFVRKAQDGRGECVALGPQAAVGSVCEERARPILSTKPGPQNVGAARPLRRALEELENGPPEKKIRAVTPMHPARDARTPDVEAEGVKPADPAHVEGYTTEGHKFPLHAPMFPGLYPGGLVSQVQEVCDSLGSPVPPGYAHPLQYLKNQAVISPLVPPFALHSLMVQRQLLASTAGPPQLYRHPSRGSSYGELLHHGLYPLSALNPQSAFGPSQLSSIHPSTKL